MAPNKMCYVNFILIDAIYLKKKHKLLKYLKKNYSDVLYIFLSFIKCTYLQLLSEMSTFAILQNIIKENIYTYFGFIFVHDVF